MTIPECIAFPCPSCGAASGVECAEWTACPGNEARMDLARAHRVRDACRRCRAPAGTWCYCEERMDDAQPGALGPAQLSIGGL